MAETDVLVIGARQAGPALGHYLRREEPSCRQSRTQVGKPRRAGSRFLVQQALYRHVATTGQLREDGGKVLARKGST